MRWRSFEQTGPGTGRSGQRAGAGRWAGLRLPELTWPWLLLAGSFVLFGWLEVAIRPVTSQAMPIAAWGVALGGGPAAAALLMRGPRLWPSIMVGVMAGQALLHGYGAGGPPSPLMLPGDLVIAAGAVLQAMAAASVLRRRFGLPLEFCNLRSFVVALLLAGPLAGLIGVSATLLSALLQGIALSPLLVAEAAVRWVVGAVGVFVLMPLTLLNPWTRPGLVIWLGSALPRFRLRAFGYLMLSLLAAVSLWMLAAVVIWTGAKQQFDSLTEDSLRAIERRVTQSEFSLDAATALFSASDRVTSVDWRRFVAGLSAGSHLPGASGIGYVEVVPRGRLDDYLKAVRLEDGLDLTPHPDPSAATGAAAKRPLFLTRFIAPLAKNPGALGRDLAADTGQRLAAIQARDSGKPVLSRPETGPDGADGPRFLLLRAVYSTGTVPGSLEARRATFRGWVYAPFSGSGLLSGLTVSQGRDLRIQVRDVSAGSDIYASPAPREAGFAPSFRKVTVLPVYGRSWSIAWTSTPAFESGLHTRGPALLLVGGLAFTMLLVIFLLSTARREALVRATVTRKTREIAAQEEQTRSIIETAVVMIALLDGDGVILTANDAIGRLFGYAREELEGMAFTDLLSGETTDYFNRSDNPHDTTGFRGIVKTVSRNGAALALDIQIRAWLTGAGKRRYTVVMGNVAERLRIEAQLRDTQYRLDVALKGANIGVFDVDLETGESIVSDTWKMLLGFPPQAMIDAQAEWRARVHPEDLPVVEKSDGDCIDGVTERSDTIYRLRALDGGWRWMRSDAVVAERDTSGRALRLIGVQMDITEQKKADQAKSEFVSTVSHELRTPLTSINGSLSLVLNTMAANIPDRALRLLNIAQKNCDRLIPLVNDILDLEKFASGRVQFSFSQENISQLVRRALVDNKPYADQFGVRLRLVHNEPKATATIDVNRFQQVMANLLSNASKFSERGGTVEIAIEREGGMLKISVTDTGKGIPPEFRSRIFQPFSQADSSATREKGGTGLGLNITKQIIERMGGQIDFVSEPGVRTTFWFTLPLEGAAAAPAARERAARDGAEAVPGAARPLPRILHVENDTDFAEIIAASFGRQAALVHAERQTDIAEVIGNGRYDLVILDSAQPDGADARLIDLVRQAQPGTPLIALTASDKTVVDPRIDRVIIKSRTRFDEIVAVCLDTISSRKATATASRA
ncbi:CHASE domain-containing protein [Acidimangrovimonas pyrenivorans]|uniref:histidine kinase n=1 Tax=Acidimangrovimonas pyrenivorans TaxID=2030798 RepID=A0ABV7AGW6_9RHOB